jgi:hypothetical protein
MYGVLALSFIPFLFFGFWPWTTFTLNGKSLTYSEFWLSGFGPLALLFVSFMSYLCLATAKGQNWSRWGNLSFWSAIFLLFGYGSLLGLFISALFIAALRYYFFKSSGVNLYYSSFGANNA